MTTANDFVTQALYQRIEETTTALTRLYLKQVQAEPEAHDAYDRLIQTERTALRALRSVQTRTARLQTEARDADLSRRFDVV